jgi:putative hydrolase of the HAD superfamily
MIRAVFFDLDNTLVDRQAAFERYLAELGRRFPALDAERMRALDEHGLAPRHTFCEAVVQCFPCLGMSASELWDDFAEGLARAVEPRPHITELLSRVGRRYRLAAVSNGSGRRQREKLARAGLAELLPDCFISGEIGARKPDPRLFHFALDSTGLRPDEVLFVGDDPVRDIAGAHGVGLHTCWISHGRPYPANAPRPGMSVARVEELLEGLAGESA